jgi:serine protease AprX
VTTVSRLLARALLALAFTTSAVLAAGDFTPSPRAKIDPWLVDRLLAAGEDSFLVRFDEGASHLRALDGRDGSAAVYGALRSRALSCQAAARAWLDGRGIGWRSLWIVNALEVRGDLALAEALAGRPEVVRVVGNPRVRGIDAVADAGAGEPGADGVEWGVATIRASTVWQQDGVRGAGIVVASADTGVEWTHPAIRDKYRGWDGTQAHHDYNWYDPIENQPAPLDDNDHGTHTVGTMVGDDGAGNQIGVAPDARWIGCRNMDHGFGQPSTYLACMQYFIAPWPHGGDPDLDGDPARAPHIVNNSWGCPPSEGCDPGTLLDGVAATRKAGIFFIAAAGNAGPSCSTVSDPPAFYADAFSAGATDANNTLALFSSKGPVTIDGSSRIKPDVAAPGSGVRSSVRGGGYASFSGTSMASPHTAGAAALLWSAKPQVSGLIGISRCLMARSTNPSVGNLWPNQCGGTSRLVRPNNLFGWGLVDAYSAIHFGPDGDADGIADPCDCAAANAGAYDPPGEVSGVSAASKVRVEWGSLSRPAGDGTVYDLLRGDLATLAADGIAAATCLATGLADAGFDDADTPSPDAGWYYVVQGRNACGTGGYGASSSGAARTHAACP